MSRPNDEASMPIRFVVQLCIWMLALGFIIGTEVASRFSQPPDHPKETK